VLLVLAAASFLVLESGKGLRINYEGAAAHRTSASGGALLESGLFIAREVLLDDLRITNSGADHRFEEWAKADELYEKFSSSFTSGELEGTIEAEDGRISINSLVGTENASRAAGEIFVRLVQALCGAHGIEAKATDYLASIKVWLGAKDTLGDTEWYAQEEPSYAPAKGPFLTSRELLLVRWKGVEPEDRRKVFYGSGSIPGLKDFITVWGSGKINVNMAPREVVAAMCPDADLKREFVEAVDNYRGNGANLFSAPWYVEIASRLGVDMAKFPSAGLGVTSTVFRVSLTASVGAGRINSTSIVQRSPKSCVVLFENIH
jgi:Type II secretory pathway, component PulK